MAMSQGAILIVSFATILAWKQILHFLGVGEVTAVVVTAVHGLLVLLVFLLSFALVLYFAPDAEQCWEWITPGSLVGSVVLLVVSVLFRVYVAELGQLQRDLRFAGRHRRAHELVWLCALTLLTAAEVNKVIKDASPLGDSCGPEFLP